MAENVDDPIEESALRQEKVLSHPDDGNSILRVLSRKSVHGADVKWTEEVKKSKSGARCDSAETIVGKQAERPEDDRGTN
jgi:hypothetical protein